MELNANWMKRLSEAQRDYKFKLTSATQRWAPIPALSARKMILAPYKKRILGATFDSMGLDPRQDVADLATQLLCSIDTDPFVKEITIRVQKMENYFV
jgi:hypothetical protein